MADEKSVPVELSDTEMEHAVGGGAKKPPPTSGSFLKIDGVDGESTDDKHKGEIQLES